MKLREPRCDCEHDPLAQRVAKLEEQLFTAMERIGTLEAENGRICEENRQLRGENARLHQQVVRLEQELDVAGADESNNSRSPRRRRMQEDRTASSRGVGFACRFLSGDGSQRVSPHPAVISGMAAPAVPSIFRLVRVALARASPH